MTSLYAFLRIEILVIVVALAAVVVYQLLARRIGTVGLLHVQLGADGKPEELSPGRVQLLTVTVIAAIIYLVEATESGNTLPELPDELLWILAGSHGLYLSGKATPVFAAYLQRIRRTNDES